MRRLADSFLPNATLVVMIAAIYLVFMYVPTDRVQGVVQRIFYFHVPLAFMTFLAFATVAVASACYLWRGDRGWDHLAHAAAEVGMVFCSLVLITGPIWAKPIWGTWWTWDARLTTTLILWLIYAAYLMVRSVAAPAEAGARYAAILGIVGAIDIPIINRSVYWWRTIHPAVLITREGGSGLADTRMQLTLAVCALGFLLLFVWLVWIRLEGLRLLDRLEELRLQLMASNGTPDPWEHDRLAAHAAVER